ncbi:hypothetical protein [Thalassospira sp. TSL5-1]|uniref:hypothetical protein n=1 Tax=Thalassospira sp. TSL5-1 TaxID=1544451 RepID=UPI00093FCF03|nr:hypothetical protein [Thalassospira sp. TSL5-1]
MADDNLTLDNGRDMALLDPVTVEITVPRDPDAAFIAFTEGFGDWWPRATHTIAREDCTGIRMHPGLGGEIIETAKGRTPQIWGKIEIWLPGEQVAFTWHPGWDSGDYTRVSVSFDQNAFGHCVIKLVHWEWENLGEIATAVRDGYITGWQQVFGEVFATYLRQNNK